MLARSTRTFMYSLWLGGVVSCRAEPSAPAASAGPSSPGAAPVVATTAPIPRALATPYPPGRWRLAKPQALTRSMLWVSHILIRHSQVAAGAISFNTTFWQRAPAPPARPREEAFTLAQQIAAEVAAQPERFAEIARRRSEDDATRERGGSLGGTDASRFYPWPEVLDALAALAPGECSRVVETEFGFHVLQRRVPPRKEQLSGRRIIIGYDDAPWLHELLARWHIPKRTRAEAEARARHVYDQARAAPASFAALVSTYSDHQDAARDGDFGAWSTREPTPFPIEVEVLGELAIGQIAPPLDTGFGYQIIQRTPPEPRETFAMEIIQWRADPRLAANDPGSVTTTLGGLAQLLQELRAEPERFAELQQRYCCPGVDQWPRGQGPVVAERALHALALGEIGAEPVRLGPTRFALVKRVAPEHATPFELSLELPAPEQADVDFFFGEAGRFDELASAQRIAGQRLALAGAELEAFNELHDARARYDSTTSEEQRVAFLTELRAQVRALLGEARFDIYREVLRAWATRRLLSPAGVEPNAVSGLEVHD